jgi:Flavin reductase like domain
MALDAATDDLRSSFKLAMRRFPAAVTVITSADQTRRHGMTATAVSSLQDATYCFSAPAEIKAAQRGCGRAEFQTTEEPT